MAIAYDNTHVAVQVTLRRTSMTNVTANEGHVLYFPFRYAHANKKQRANQIKRMMIVHPLSKVEITMTTNGPLPTTLVFLNELPSLPKAAKVRFLGWYAFFFSFHPGSSKHTPFEFLMIDR